MLNELKKCDSIESIISMVADYYSAYDENNYIPAIYKEGSLIDREGYKSEFFAKLIIRPCNMDINESWLKGNDEGDFIDGSSNINASNCVYNLVLSKKYYQNFIYTFNPCLYFSNSYIYEKVQDHKKVANLVFFDKDFSTNEWPVLISNNDDEILLLKQSLKDFINTEVNVYPKYNLSVEFEYRDKEHILVDRNSKKGENYYINNKTDSDMTWINGTLDIDFKLPDYNNLNIITNKISGGIRPINENNWNDDMDAGLIVFKKSCLKMLKKRYIVLELEMIDLFTKDSTLIDILDDKVVFWEGEFNQLPYEVKKELEPFNIKRDSNDIISPPNLKNNIYIIYPKTKYFGEIESREKIKTIEIAEKLIPLLNYCKEEIDYYNSIKNKSKGQEKVSNIFNIIYKNFLNPIDIIFFDEPENFLDDLGLRKITKLFSLIEQSKIKLIIASHNYNLCSLLKVPIDNIIFINKVFDSKKSIYINKMFSLKLKQVKEIFKEETIEFESFIKDKKLDSDSGIYSKLHFYENENLLNMFLKDALNSEQFYRSLFYKKIILFEGATEKRIISKLQSEELQENYYYITFGKPFMLFFCKLFRLIGKDVIVIIDSDKIFKKNSTRYNIAYGITMYLKYKYPNSVVDFEPDLEGYFCIDKQKYSRNGISSNEAKVFASDDFFSSKRNKNKFITYINKR